MSQFPITLQTWDCGLSHTSALGRPAYEIGPLGRTVAIVPPEEPDAEEIALLLKAAPRLLEAVCQLQMVAEKFALDDLWARNIYEYSRQVVEEATTQK